MFYDKGSTRIVDPYPSFRMRRLIILWRHEYDVIESRDVATFLQAPYWTQTANCLVNSFRDI